MCWPVFKQDPLKITVITNYILGIEFVRSDSFPHGIPCGVWFLFSLTPLCQELKPINRPGNQVSPLQLLRALPALLPPSIYRRKGKHWKPSSSEAQDCFIEVISVSIKPFHTIIPMKICSRLS